MSSPVRQKEFGSDLGLVHQVVVAGRKFGADEEFWKALTDEATFRRVVRLVQGDEVPSGFVTLEGAARIMEGNFHQIGDAESQFGFRLNAKQKRALLNVPFSVETLQSVRETHVLVPILPISLMYVHQAVAKEFYPTQQEDPWFGHSDHKFAHKKAELGWHLVRKDEVPGSRSTRWEAQQTMVKLPDFVPSVSVVVQAAMLHFLQTGEKLFVRYWVRTSDVTAFGDRVHVNFGPDGLIVSYWDDGAYDDAGVASARKSN